MYPNLNYHEHIYPLIGDIKKDISCTIWKIQSQFTVTGLHSFILETVPLKMLHQEQIMNSFSSH